MNWQALKATTDRFALHYFPGLPAVPNWNYDRLVSENYIVIAIPILYMFALIANRKTNLTDSTVQCVQVAGLHGRCCGVTVTVVSSWPLLAPVTWPRPHRLMLATLSPPLARTRLRHWTRTQATVCYLSRRLTPELYLKYFVVWMVR